MPEALCELFSPRSREVAEARARVERELGVRLHGGALAVLAKETRQAKDHDLDPSRLRAGVGRGRAGARLRARRGQPPAPPAATRARSRIGSRKCGMSCSSSCASRAQRSVSRAPVRSCSRPRAVGCRPRRRRGCWRGWSARRAAICCRSPAGESPRGRSASSSSGSWPSPSGRRGAKGQARRWSRRIARPDSRRLSGRLGRAGSSTLSSAARSSCCAAPPAGCV